MDKSRRPGPISMLRFLYHLPSFVKIFGRLWRDPRVSWVAKSMPVLALLYIILPVDFVTDFIPVLGQLDDLAVVMLALRTFVQLSPREVVKEHIAAVDGRLGQGD